MSLKLQSRHHLLHCLCIESFDYTHKICSNDFSGYMQCWFTHIFISLITYSTAISRPFRWKGLQSIKRCRGSRTFECGARVWRHVTRASHLFTTVPTWPCLLRWRLASELHGAVPQFFSEMAGFYDNYQLSCVQWDMQTCSAVIRGRKQRWWRR